MTTIPAALQTHLAKTVTTLATCAEITRTDGTIVRITDHDRDIVVADSGEGVDGTYVAAIGYTSSTLSTDLSLSVDQLDVYGLLNVLGVDDGDLLAGLYDYAEVKFFIVNWSAPDGGIIKLNRGTLGQVTLQESQFVVEFRGMFDPLQSNVGRVLPVACDVKAFGDAKCKVRLTAPTWAALSAYTQRLPKYAETGDIVEPTTPNGFWYYANNDGTSGSSEPTWGTVAGGSTNDGDIEWIAFRAAVVSGSVTGVTSRQVFTDSAITDAADWFTNGKVDWLTGNNAGRSMEIKKHAASGVFTLAQPMPDAIQASDTYTLTVGCRRRHLEDCRDKFDNTANNHGVPAKPTRYEVMEYVS